MRTAGILGFLGVALGAMGAHAVKTWLGDAPDAAQRLDWWHTAVLYHLVHALFVGFARDKWPTRLAIAGVVLFSGSLYLMTLSAITVPLVFITPVGGLCFLAAWGCLIKGRRA